MSSQTHPVSEEGDGDDSFTWTSLSLDDLERVYYDTIADEMRAHGIDVDSRYPTYKWLAENGFRGFAYALRETHERTVAEFFREYLDYPHPSDAVDDEYEWGFEHDRTKQEIENYLDGLRRRRGYAESTLSSKRARLAKYARTYERIHGMSDLLRPAGDIEDDPYASEETVAFGRAVDVFEELNDELATKRSAEMYFSEVKQFYDRLERWGYVPFNPVAEVPEEFDWDDKEDLDNKGLAADDVRNLYAAADNVEDRLIIVGLAGWGLRPNEVAALHCFQLQNFVGRDPDDLLNPPRADSDKEWDDGEWPYVQFDGSRKNGPGSVTVLYGIRDLYDRTRELDGSEWNGFLFPSTQSSTGHLSTRTIRERFKRLADDAGVTVDGETPTPKMGRRFWYSTYQDVMQDVYERLDTIAAEQGSADAGVVDSNYLSEDVRRRARRELMHEALSDAFGNVR